MTTMGGIELATPRERAGRSIGMLLWGASGCGKTTLASTFPGPKLWISYDHGATDVIVDSEDVLVFDTTALPISHVERWKETDPFGINKVIKENGIKTIVLDSLTTLSDVALRYGVDHAGRTQQHAKAGISVEDPGFGGYGRRKTWTMQAIHMLLRIGAAHGCNVVFIAHEDSPVTDDKGAVMYITMTLGSDMPEKGALAVSEVWYMRDYNGKREVFLRPSFMRKPMKSRMFDTRTKAQFLWDYDALTHKGLTMAALLDDWKAAGYDKLLPP